MTFFPAEAEDFFISGASSKMIQGKTVVAIIPARGGSQGIPRKNVLPIAGKPLLAHVIEQALASETVDRVFVSTDDPEIAEAARRHGAGVIDRPAEISGSRASSESALSHALETLEAVGRDEFDLLVFLQCTSPLTSSEDIDGNRRGVAPRERRHGPCRHGLPLLSLEARRRRRLRRNQPR